MDDEKLLPCDERIIEAANEQIRTLFAETAILLTHPDKDRQALAKERVFAILYATRPPTDTEVVERVDAARFAVATARLQLARLCDYAIQHGLTDESPLATDAIKAIAGLDEAFSSSTDMATGLSLSQAKGVGTQASKKGNERERQP